ncbi:uncharacterized protein LOC102808209 [Saccoglossus kowalevskii]|uniref:Polyubiquitin-like n=1 Tax=Saccoglossus kowalevskii TaxID=10224 RepID=A0ABM0M3Y5_SACKO|nr:PREDICTED: polyubiquitin-like [Saccoglossus kowalevskii]
MRVFIIRLGKTITIDCDQLTTIANLKDMAGVPGNCHLVYGSEFLTSYNCLMDYEIEDGSTISVAEPLRGGGWNVWVEILTGNSKTQYGCDMSTTIGNLKAMIQKKEGIPPVQQCLMYAGKQLADEQILYDLQPPSENFTLVLHIIKDRQYPTHKKQQNIDCCAIC